VRYLFLFLLSLNLYAIEKITVINSVSLEERTFVISLGAKDGIQKGQESLFSTEYISLAARATNVSRNFSLWKLSDKFARVPFVKEEFVVFSNNVVNIQNEVPLIRERLKATVFRPQEYFKFKGYFTETIAESLSDTDEEINATRRGYHLEAIFEKDWGSTLSWGAGIRFDREIQTLQDPALEIPTTRWLAIGEINYNFPRFIDSKNNIYASAGFGFGLDKSVVDEREATGTAWAIPVIKLGIQTNEKDQLKYLFEFVFETIFVEEVFPDGQKQSTNQTNAKVGIGVKF